MPSALEALQRRFVAAVAEGDEALASEVTGGGRLTPEDSVRVYRRAYAARLTEALGETYVRVWRALGDEAFLAACAAYIAGRPSSSYNLSDYGKDFPSFLDAREEAVRAPFLGDLARLEWAFKELFHAPQHASLAPEALARAVSPSSVLRFGAASALLALGHRVRAIWTRDLEDGSPLDPGDWSGREFVFLYKKEGRVFSSLLAPPQAAALAALRAGRPVEEALAGAEGLDEDSAAALFRELSESGAVVEAAGTP